MPAYECAYCGAIAPATDDHVPPRSFFRGLAQLQLRSVKACEPCNRGASLDDEYFRDTVLKYHRVSDQSQAQSAVESMMRAMALPAKRQYAAATMSSLRSVEVVDPVSGLLAVRDAVSVDECRLQRTAIRYARGLHRAEYGVRVPADMPARAVVNPEAVHANAEAFELGFRGADLIDIQLGVFWALVRRERESRSTSTWLMVFYDAFPVIVAFRPSVAVPSAAS